MRRAFTLIELLVVIAIIAILAAILFPVFAQAKEAAKKTAALSNVKQVSLSFPMYMGDNDDVYVMYRYQNVGVATLNEIWWPKAVEPYVKSWPLFLAPGAKQTHPTWNPTPANTYWWYNWMRWPQLGMNVEYLNPANTCAEFAATPGIPAFGKPISGTAVASPSATVAFANTKTVGDAAGYFTSAAVASPAGPWVPEMCTYTNWGWGVGSAGDTANLYPGNPTSTGHFATYYAGGGNVGMVDGSAKYMKPGRLAAGTNWRVGIANTAVQVTDRSQYIWDTQE